MQRSVASVYANGIDCISRKGRFPMTLRRNTSIAAFAFLALACAMLSSSTPWAAEPALTVAAGPGDSSSPGDADRVPGEASDTAPAVEPGDDQASPQESEPAKDAGAPGAEETAEPKEAAPEAEPTEKAEKPAKGEEHQAAPAKEEDEDKEAAAPAEVEQAEAQSSAAAEKVKAGDIPVPTDPVALAAFQSLELNCSRCHQAGPTLKRRKPAKNFGNILHLDELAKDPNFILPGNPDGSKLFIQVAKKEMPYDCYQDFDCKREPTEKEVQAIYDWIKSLGGFAVAACTDRKPIDEEAIVTAIAADLDAQQEHLRKGMRYITLSNLYNACAPETDMVRYRQGVVKLLNSLSREPDVLKMRTIDQEQTIVAFNLDDLGWTEADWNRIISAYPYAMKPDTTAYQTVATITDTPLAWIRGDWFAFTASRPPLYYDLLKLPKTFAELEKQENLDVKSDIEKFLVKRAGFQHSGVSKHNRLIERHGITTGYFWTSYDFKGDKPEQSLFVHPLGPDGPDAFKHDGGETIFSLPNGFQAYYLNKATGERLDKGPTEIVLDDTQLDRAVTNGISCMGCHNQGIRQAEDDIRKHVLNDRTFSKDVRTKVEALYPEPTEFKGLLDQDADHFRNAVKRAGLDPELDSQKVGVESINFLSKAYEKAIDLRIAAAEFGLAVDAFANGLEAAGGESGQLKRRLEQGVLPREILESEFKDIIVKVSDNEPIEITAAATANVAKVGGKTKEEAHDFDLALTSDRTDYKVNDLPVFSITSKENCHLTLINVDASGEGTVIFPNKFQQDNLLKAGKEVQFPGSDAPFQFRLKDPGTETVIAICNASGKTADGIQHDFKKRQFTDLGNYRGFLTRQIVAEAKDKLAEGQKEKEKTPKKDTGAAPTPSEISSRTAIKVQVK
jgi:Domain of unknown function (DUF4384)